MHAEGNYLSQLAGDSSAAGRSGMKKFWSVQYYGERLSSSHAMVLHFFFSPTLDGGFWPIPLPIRQIL